MSHFLSHGRGEFKLKLYFIESEQFKTFTVSKEYVMSQMAQEKS